LLIATLVRGH
jgi:hypothetical protein